MSADRPRTDTPTIGALPSRSRPPCGTVPDPADDQFDRVALAVDGEFCGHRARLSVDVGGVELLACAQHYAAAIERAAEMAGVEPEPPKIGGDRREDYDVEVLRAALADQPSALDEEIPWCHRCDAPIVPERGARQLRCGTCGEPAFDDVDVDAGEPGDAPAPSEQEATATVDGDPNPDVGTGQTTLDEWGAGS